MSRSNPFEHHLKAAGQATRRSFKSILFLDMETRSELDIKKVDADTYAAHPSTEIMCISYAIDDGPIHRWTEADGSTADIPFGRKDILNCFHNAEFETAIFRHKLNAEIPIEQIVDSAAVARHAGLPGALDPLAEFFGGGKDTEGRRSMLKLSKPRRPSASNPDLFWRPETKPDDFAAMYAYCDWDVHWTREAMRNMPALSTFEIDTYAATYRMNRTGFPIDLPSAKKLNQMVDDTREQMSADMKRKHGFTLSQVKDIAEFLELPGVAKDVLRDFLKNPDIDPEKRAVAEARVAFAKTSVDKIKQMILRARLDGLVHGGVIYGAAERTLRFAGSGVQPQNIPRGLGAKQDALFECLDAIPFTYGGEELDTIAGMLRGLIAPPHGRLHVGAYSQIEARLLAWIVGDEELLTVFREGGDPYKMMAGKIYHKPIDDVTPSERFMGKQTVLGCGYGLGKYGFQTMLDVTYDVQIDEDEADTIVKAYRKNAPKVTAAWRKIDGALNFGINNVGKKFAVVKGKIAMKFEAADRFWIELPSGRKLRYYQVKREKTSKGANWSCFGRLKSGAGYGRVKIYGGALIGHITQSTARDVVANAMVRLDKLDHKLCLTVHDELDFSVRDDTPEMREAFAFIQHTMENAVTLRIPVFVDSETGPNWGQVD